MVQNLSTGYASNIAALNTVSQTSTAGWRGLWISPYILSTGSSTNYLIDVGINTAASGGGTHSSVFNVDKNGNIVTSNTATNGYMFYNTTDQTTNYQRSRMYWTGGTFQFKTENGGSAGTAPIIINGYFSERKRENTIPIYHVIC